MIISHFLRNSICFAVTHKDAYVFISKRSFDPKENFGAPSDGSTMINMMELRMYRVQREHIGQMWMIATIAAVKNINSFLTLDGPAIWHALDAIGIHPLLCRVCLCGNSISRVYDVTLPNCVTFPTSDSSSGPSIWGIRSSPKEPNFAIKVGDVSKEIDILEKTLPNYYLGAFQKGVLFDRGIRRLFSTPTAEHALNVKGWWSYLQNRSLELCGDVIFMKWGQSYHDIAEKPDHMLLFEDCLLSLSLLHSLGYCHRDVRKANMVLIDGIWQIVDFGLCCKENSLEDTNAHRMEGPNIFPLLLTWYVRMHLTGRRMCLHINGPKQMMLRC